MQQEVATLPLSVETAAVGGRLRAHLRAAGVVMGDFDTLIAAHAMTLSLTLVTNDAIFQRVTGLKIENWA